MSWTYLFVWGLTYLIGSIPFGWGIVWLTRGVDIRKEGTGNIEASNVTLVAGWFSGALVVLLDVFKGVSAIWLAGWMLGEGHTAWPVLAAGFLAILGHDFSFFLKGGGGKGIATLGGVLAVLDFRLYLLCLFLWLFFAFIVRVMVGSTLVVLFLLPFLMWFFFHDVSPVGFALANLILALYRHQDNLHRMARGEEPTLFGLSKFLSEKRLSR